MATGAGYPFVMGAAVEVSGEWGGTSGAGAAATITDRIPVIKESLTDAINMLLNEALIGRAGHDTLDLDNISVTGSIETDLRYTQKSGSFFCGSDLLLSLAMGQAPTIVGGSTNILILAESPARYLTIAMDKRVSYWELVSCWLKGFKMMFKTGSPVSCDFQAAAHRLRRSSTTNGATQFSNLAATGGKRVLFPDVTFRINSTITSGALAAGDNYGLSEFTLEYDAAMSDPEFSSPDASVVVGSGTHGTDSTNRSPSSTLPGIRNGRRNVLLKFNTPRYTTDQFTTWRDAGTELQMNAFTSIDSGAKTFKLNVPRFKIEKVDAAVEGPGTFPTKIEARALYNGGTTSGSGANTVMVNANTDKIPQEFQIEIKNTTDGRTAAIWS